MPTLSPQFERIGGWGTFRRMTLLADSLYKSLRKQSTNSHWSQSFAWWHPPKSQASLPGTIKLPLYCSSRSGTLSSGQFPFPIHRLGEGHIPDYCRTFRQPFVLHRHLRPCHGLAGQNALADQMDHSAQYKHCKSPWWLDLYKKAVYVPTKHSNLSHNPFFSRCSFASGDIIIG